jgi:hypothetical protein
MNKEKRITRREFLGKVLKTGVALSVFGLPQIVSASELGTSKKYNPQQSKDLSLHQDMSPNYQEGGQESEMLEEILSNIRGEGRPRIINTHLLSSPNGNLREMVFGVMISGDPRFFSVRKTERMGPNDAFQRYKGVSSFLSDDFNMRGVAKVGGDYLVTGIHFPDPTMSSKIRVLLVGDNGQVVYQADLERGKYNRGPIMSAQIASVSLDGGNYYFLPVDNLSGLPVFIERDNIKESRIIPVENARRMSLTGLRAMPNGRMIDVFVTGYQGELYGIRVNPDNLNQSITKITPGVGVDDFDIRNGVFYGISEPTLRIITGQIGDDNGITGIRRYRLPLDISQSVGEIGGIAAINNDTVAICRQTRIYPEDDGQLATQIFLDLYGLPPDGSTTLTLKSSVPISKIPYVPGRPSLVIYGSKINTANIIGQKVMILSTPFGAYAVSFNSNNLYDSEQLSAYPINAGLGAHHLYLPTVRRKT